MSEYSPEHLRGVAKDWKERQETEDWDRAPEPRVVEFVEKHKDEIGPKVLDIGSGQGRHLKYLIEKGYKVTGLELTKEGLEKTKKRFEQEQIPQPDLVRGDFHRLPFKDESFDTAISIKVLHNNNWAGAEQAFAEISRVLKPGGRFFCMLRSTTNKIPDEGRMIEDHGKTWVRPGKEADDAEVMLHDFTLEELQELAKHNGFEIDYTVTPPVDERQNEAGETEPGQWNVTFNKKA